MKNENGLHSENGPQKNIKSLLVIVQTKIKRDVVPDGPAHLTEAQQLTTRWKMIKNMLEPCPYVEEEECD